MGRKASISPVESGTWGPWRNGRRGGLKIRERFIPLCGFKSHRALSRPCGEHPALPATRGTPGSGRAPKQPRIPHPSCAARHHARRIIGSSCAPHHRAVMIAARSRSRVFRFAASFSHASHSLRALCTSLVPKHPRAITRSSCSTAPPAVSLSRVGVVRPHHVSRTLAIKEHEP